MKINLLFSIDDNFIQQLKTTIYSIQQNSQDHDYTIYVLQKEPLEKQAELQDFLNQLNITYVPIILGDEQLFADAPISKRYPETIYYRLLAHKYLPQELTKILYLDADILCINDITPLYQLNLGTDLYAAASHQGLTQITDAINKVRLDTYENEGYFNSGVLLMNLSAIREKVTEQDIFNAIKDHGDYLLLPDQDILNYLYGKYIVSIPDELYNYDTRKNLMYQTISVGKWDINWVIKNNVFLHFCGKDKPWSEKYTGNFRELYRHYLHKTELL
ncbi:glycosyl transferase [Companilactobacillus sp. RD055328]|uniref:glycosyltransferase family 8 protein n=1 Tax=Companilactobacillus sp. RD055328 TaxID=2916634 RepID=UPI001FC883D0|nr:glycosyltransferase family 8 protein [Companilactobacillus sp. RD055328]GKQ42389.1 glycosyl transferase [Companilactobacillus sp. RD055328]